MEARVEPRFVEFVRDWNLELNFGEFLFFCPNGVSGLIYHPFCRGNSSVKTNGGNNHLFSSRATFTQALTGANTQTSANPSS